MVPRAATRGRSSWSLALAHLLVVESWVGPSSVSLPLAIRELGHRFTFLTRNPEHYRRSSPIEGPHPLLQAERIIQTETNKLPDLLDVVAAEHARAPFDGVLTSCDYYLETVAEIAARLGLPGTSAEAVRTARIKDLMREAMARAGLPGPRFRSASSREEAYATVDEIDFPLVFKPVDLCAGMYVRLVRDRAELDAAMAALEAFPINAREQARPPRFLLEQFMTGEEVSVETGTYRGDTRVIGITDKALAGHPAFIEAGHMFPARLRPELAESACNLVRNALKAVGYDHGVAHTEVKLTPLGPRIVEINARLGGNYIPDLVRAVTCIDIPQVMVELALGERPALEPREGEARSAAVRFLLPTSAGEIVAVHGTDTLAADSHVVEWEVKAEPGMAVRRPVDNSDYLGRVVALDRDGPNARELAEAAANRVQIHLAQHVAV
jgi:biotin carboxylase